MSSIENDELNSIAIIGMAGKFPKAKDIYEFWNNLCNGVDGVSFYSDDELINFGIDQSLIKDPDYVKARADLDDIDKFDSDFFRYNSKEADIMDPQHRMLLECAWATMEDAGWDPEKYDGKIGVFAGESMSSYMLFNIYPTMGKVASTATLQAAIGNDKDSITSTIAYKLNLTGPAITVQSSSSTSLVSVSMACQSILNYQCDMALAGGVSVGPPEKSGYLYQEGGILSHSGHTLSFDSRADGFVPGSGLGLVLLKRLDEAIADRDHIYAVIKGCAVNNDGSAKVSYSAPSVNAQAEVVAEAQAAADVNPESISYVECHGTGTKMGDPIEFEAITQAFRAYTNKKQYCAIGSAKSYIGHLDAAAGVTGLIKTSLMLENKKIPPVLNFQKPNEKINLENSPFYINKSLIDWNDNLLPRRAGVSSIGMGGTNAHVILEEAPVRLHQRKDSGPNLIVLSAKTEAALERVSDNLKSFIERRPNIDLRDMSYTLSSGRRAFSYRRFLVESSVEGIAHKLERCKNIVVPISKVEYSNRPIVFMFTGQGSQYVNMAKELYENEAYFKEIIDQCCEIINNIIGFDVRTIMFMKHDSENETENKLVQTWLTQPLLFSIEYAYTMLLKQWGGEPKAMIGHSLGEYVAACIAGVFTLEQALRIVCQRGKCMAKMSEGTMLAVKLSEEELRLYLNDNIDLSVINSPEECIVSGKAEDINELVSILVKDEIKCIRLKTSHAFHSRMVDEIISEFKALKEFGSLKAPKIPFISNVTGTWITDQEAISVEYWARHMRCPVQFMKGIHELSKNQEYIYLEVGTGALSRFVNESGVSLDNITNHCIRHKTRPISDREQLLYAIGDLWSKGAKIDWENYYEADECYRVALPTYPFTKRSHWIEPELEMIQNKRTSKVSYTEAVEESEEKMEYSTYEKVKLIWQELLGIEVVDDNSDFFVLGGHSLLATQLISRLKNYAGIHVSIQKFYENPTIAGLMSNIEVEEPQNDSDTLGNLLKEIETMSEEEVSMMLAAMEEEDE